MISALGDCVPVLQQVKHEESPQVMLDTFEKEISDTLHEVSLYTNTTEVNRGNRQSLLSGGISDTLSNMFNKTGAKYVETLHEAAIIPKQALGTHPPSSKRQLCGTV